MGLPLKEADDGLTLLYLLGVPAVELLGITTTFGNGRIDQVYSQTRKLADQLYLEIPVFRGAGEKSFSAETPAADFLVEMVNQHPKEITMLATGPLSNLHAAAKLDPHFYSKVKRVAAMGGYLTPLRLGYRNLKELNFSADPQAAFNLLNASCPVTVFPGSATLEATYKLGDILGADYWPPKLKGILLKWLIAFGLYCGVTAFYLWDLLPAVYLTKPSFFSFENLPIASTVADLQEGMLVPGNTSEKGAIINIEMRIRDRAGFYQQLERAWRRAAKNYPLENIQ